MIDQDSKWFVAAAEAGLRLDVCVAQQLGISRSAAERLIEAGVVKVDGAARPKRHLVVEGETIVAASHKRETQVVEATEGVELPIIHEDESLIVIDKPVGVVVHPGPGHRSGTVAQILGARLAGGNDPSRAGIVHRLDKMTSGLLVVAKSDAAHAALSGAIRERTVEREYAALVEGHLPSRSGTIDAPIGREGRHPTRMAVNPVNGRFARTHFETVVVLPRDTLLEVRLETGRTHQIRAHMAAIGHPVVGDLEYGGSERYGLNYQFLHAQRLAFDHPDSGDRMQFTSPLPPKLALALKEAELR